MPFSDDLAVTTTKKLGIRQPRCIVVVELDPATPSGRHVPMCKKDVKNMRCDKTAPSLFLVCFVSHISWATSRHSQGWTTDQSGGPSFGDFPCC